jgi:hypothetical protein
MGYLHLSAWPVLQPELEQRGIPADGPVLGTAEKVTLNPIARRRGPSMRLRLLFEPSLVGPSNQATNLFRTRVICADAWA